MPDNWTPDPSPVNRPPPDFHGVMGNYISHGDPNGAVSAWGGSTCVDLDTGDVYTRDDDDYGDDNWVVKA